jgi:hypothetical protein
VGCNCAESLHGGEREERVLSVLGQGGLREIGEETLSIRPVIADFRRALDKAGRAAALNLGDQVIQLQADDGERANRQARRQMRHLIERIDERMNRDDWPELSERSRVAFDERSGREVIADTGAHLRKFIYEHDAFRPDDAGKVIELWEQTAKRVVDEGLSGSMLLLRERLEGGLAALEGPETASQPLSPQPFDQRLLCVALVLGIFAVLITACFFIPFCWCCAWWVFVAWLALALAACTTVTP